MRKKVFALVLAATITFGSTVPTLASTAATSPKPTTTASSSKHASPEKKNTVTPTPTPRPTITRRITVVPPRTSPKTGQTDYLLYGMLGATAFGSVVIVSKKKKDENTL